MRLLGALFAAVCVAYLNAPCTFAQGSDERRPEEQAEPYHTHRDTRHGHDRVYPDRGAVFGEASRGAIAVNDAGLSYRFADGVWFEPRGPAFIVVAPPIGLPVPTLPAFATAVANSGETFRGGQMYLYANGTYYRPRPDRGGYEVVNDPVEAIPPAGSAAAAAPPWSAPMQATAAAAPPSTASGTVPAALAPAALTATPAPTAATAPTAASSVLMSTGPPRGPKVCAYPRNGQTPDEQARDQYACSRFAVEQTGFDPMRPHGGVPSAQTAERQSDHERGQAACLEGRGYTTR